MFQRLCQFNLFLRDLIDWPYLCLLKMCGLSKLQTLARLHSILVTGTFIGGNNLSRPQTSVFLTSVLGRNEPKYKHLTSDICSFVNIGVKRAPKCSRWLIATLEKLVAMPLNMGRYIFTLCQRVLPRFMFFVLFLLLLTISRGEVNEKPNKQLLDNVLTIRVPQNVEEKPLIEGTDLRK